MNYDENYFRLNISTSSIHMLNFSVVNVVVKKIIVLSLSLVIIQNTQMLKMAFCMPFSMPTMSMPWLTVNFDVATRPRTLKLKLTVNMILESSRHFLNHASLADNLKNLHVYRRR